MAAGAGLSQPPVVLINTANAITQKYFAPLLADSIFKPSPTLWRMTRQGKKLEGGGSLTWPIISQEETSGGAYYGAQNLNTDSFDSVTPAELQWRFYYQTIAIPYTDYLLNDGAFQSVSLIRAKEEIAMGSLLQKLARAVYGVSPNNTSIDLDSIITALSGSGSYAGITINTTYWECNGGTGPTSGGAVSLANMQTDYGSATYGNEEPDSIITTQSGWNAYWVLLQAQQRFMRDEETTRGGFKNHLMFNNAVVLHDQFVPAGDMVMLTSKYARPVFHEKDYFKVDPFIRPTGQRVIVSQIWVTMNLRFLTLRQHALRTGISNA